MPNPHATAVGLLLLRVVFGGLMAFNHGLPKLLGFAKLSESFASFLPLPSPVSLGLAVVGELVCALLIVVGLGTRWAAVPAVVTMLVAAFGAHGDDLFGDGEMALLYAAGFCAIGLLGPGALSLDAKVRGRS